jgi:hypothetical protein
VAFLKLALAVHPDGPPDARLVLAARRLADCAVICAVCADGCLVDPPVDGAVPCIRALLDCSDLCAAASRVLGRLGEPALTRELLGVVVQAIRLARQRCEASGPDASELCRATAEACRKAEGAVAELLPVCTR